MRSLRTRHFSWTQILLILWSKCCNSLDFQRNQVVEQVTCLSLQGSKVAGSGFELREAGSRPRVLNPFESACDWLPCCCFCKEGGGSRFPTPVFQGILQTPSMCKLDLSWQSSVLGRPRIPSWAEVTKAASCSTAWLGKKHLLQSVVLPKPPDLRQFEEFHASGI